MAKMSDKIARARTNLNLTQDQLGEKLDVSRQTISKWESDSAFPETSKIHLLAQILEVSCDYLLDANVGVDQQPIITGDSKGVSVDWSKMYPILEEYIGVVHNDDIERYKSSIKAIFSDIGVKYKMSLEDSMLVTKDILAKTYFELK